MVRAYCAQTKGKGGGGAVEASASASTPVQTDAPSALKDPVFDDRDLSPASKMLLCSEECETTPTQGIYDAATASEEQRALVKQKHAVLQGFSAALRRVAALATERRGGIPPFR